VLMTNHVHLLVTPHVAFGVGRMMQYLGRYYVRYINHTYGRTGTLWEGRYKASVVGGERYLLACYRYIELNPARAEMVSDPAGYAWSSYRYHTCCEPNTLIRDHDVFRSLGRTPGLRASRYRQLFEVALGEQMLAEIRGAVNHCHVLGGERFKTEIETMLRRRLGTGRPGRPRKEVADNDTRLPGQMGLDLKKY
jgi:putative transposase